MSLVQSAKLNGHEPWAYLRDVLERLPSHPNNRIDELLRNSPTKAVIDGRSIQMSTRGRSDPKPTRQV